MYRHTCTHSNSQDGRQINVKKFTEKEKSSKNAKLEIHL